MPKRGIVMVFTGSGKGKTTAALGTAFRALGYNMKVLMVQFIKGSWKYGELTSAKAFKNFELIPMGEGFTWVTKNRVRDVQKAREAWEFAKQRISSKEYDLVILDEINYATKYGFLNPVEVIEFLRTKPVQVHVILTGRDANQEVIDFADLVTEMREIKHPFKQGIRAQRGIEF